MRTTGTYISAVGHVGLIGWLLLGWGLSADPLEFDTMTVTTVSGEEFEEITNAARTPDPGDAEPDAPVQPEIDQTPPPAPTEEQVTEVAPPPDPVEPPVEETPPPPPPPAPQLAEVTDEAPVVPAAPPPPPPTPDVAVDDTPTPPPAEVVAPEQNDPPPPDAAPDDIVREEVVQDDTSEPEIEQPEQDPTAPTESTPEIVNQDDEPAAPAEPVVAAAPTTSMRPSARPSRPALTPAAAPEETQTAEAETPEVVEPETATDDDVAAALEAALAGGDDTPAAEAPSLSRGQSLTDIERGSFFNSIGNEWTVDTGSEAASITVTVSFRIGADRRLDGDVSLENASAGSPQAQEAAFQSARRAIWIISRSGGFPLPPEKFEAWQNVRITFDPSQMRLR